MNLSKNIFEFTWIVFCIGYFDDIIVALKLLQKLIIVQIHIYNIFNVNSNYWREVIKYFFFRCILYRTLDHIIQIHYLDRHIYEWFFNCNEFIISLEDILKFHIINDVSYRVLTFLIGWIWWLFDIRLTL